MKKILAIVAALVVMGGVACAGDFYNGDIQIQLGYASNKAALEGFLVDKDVKSKQFDLGLETWHLFRPVEIVGVGFMGDFNMGFGTAEKLYDTVGYEDGFSFSLNVAVGPAVGLYLGNVVRLGFNIGYDAGFSFEEPYRFVYDSAYVSGTSYCDVKASYSGLALGLQAKFLPESKVNPVIGWKFVKGAASSYDYYLYDPSDSYSSDTINKKFDFTQNIFYAAISFSW